MTGNVFIIFLGMVMLLEMTVYGIPVVDEVPENLCGTPVVTYVTLKDVREYLVHNNVDNMRNRFPLSFTGPPLPVHRCGNDLTPCKDSNTFCGVVKQSPVERILPMNSTSENAKTGYELLLKYVEDEQCGCVDRDTYFRSFFPDYSSPPHILSASIKLSNNINHH